MWGSAGGKETGTPVALPRQRAAETTGRRGTLLRESALIVALYLGYVSARLLANGDVEQARRHADEILHFEGWLHLDFEAATNVFISSTVWLAAPVSYWYAALHYLVTPAILVWLFLRHRDFYGRARTALVFTSAIGLVGFLLYPTAPPRFVAGYVDTLAAYADIGWWSAHASAPRGFGQFTNELAAMPSLHCGWALWVAWAVVRAGARRRWRYLAIGYAAGTAAVVVVTGNHWTLDVVVGWAVAVAGIALSATPFGRLVDDRIAATILGRGANRAGWFVVRGFQVAASSRWTVVMPVAASTLCSPATPPGASARTVQDPGAAKNLKSPLSLETTSAVNSPPESRSLTYAEGTGAPSRTT
jgi:membrane-associated phospholipid phosphatase